VRTATLANAILRDTLADWPETAVDLTRCFVCARTFSAGKGTGTNGRFCSRLCVEAHDSGYVHHHDGDGYQFPARGDGFLIDCRSCRRPFVSKGLRCCSEACERQMKEQATIAAVMAEVGAEPTGYVHRKCQQCGQNIPRYVGVGKARKETKKTARFCSKRCADKARRSALPAKAGSAPTILSEIPVE
jgi:hypothetical protein